MYECLTLLSQSDSVVLQIDDLQAVSHHRVIVDDVSDGRDELDDHLGRVVTWSRLEQMHINVHKQDHLNIHPGYLEVEKVGVGQLDLSLCFFLPQPSLNAIKAPVRTIWLEDFDISIIYVATAYAS